MPYSRLTPKPLMLFYHFFSVAFYSIYILLTSGPPASLGGKKSGPPGWIELPGLMLFSIKVVSGFGDDDSSTTAFSFRLSLEGCVLTRSLSSGPRAACSCR
jgi:squalene monooxygenase